MRWAAHRTGLLVGNNFQHPGWAHTTVGPRPGPRAPGRPPPPAARLPGLPGCPLRELELGNTTATRDTLLPAPRARAPWNGGVLAAWVPGFGFFLAASALAGARLAGGFGFRRVLASSAYQPTSALARPLCQLASVPQAIGCGLVGPQAKI